MNDEYKNVKDKIEYLRNYYLDLQDYIERFSFPRIDYYYLIKNISQFYVVLDKAKVILDSGDIVQAKKIIPKKLEFKNSIYQNTVSIKYALDEVKKNLKENKENQEADESKFKQKNENI